MKYYIIVTEDGEIHKHEGEITEDLKLAVDEGILSIVDITDPKNPTEYYNDEYSPVEQFSISS